MKKNIFAILTLLLMAVPCWSADSPVFTKDVPSEIGTTFQQVQGALEEVKFWVIFEADIGASLENFKDEWGAEYNKNNLQGLRSMIVCNAGWANLVSNLDPDALAFCPLRITLVQRDKSTRILFARPSSMAPDSKALPALEEVEQIIIKAINSIR